MRLLLEAIVPTVPVGAGAWMRARADKVGWLDWDWGWVLNGRRGAAGVVTFEVKVGHALRVGGGAWTSTSRQVHRRHSITGTLTTHSHTSKVAFFRLYKRSNSDLGVQVGQAVEDLPAGG